jgi:protein O-mannosyl-transferase
LYFQQQKYKFFLVYIHNFFKIFIEELKYAIFLQKKVKKVHYFVLLVPVLLFTYFVFSGVTESEFLNWDDQIQVVSNSDIDSLNFSTVKKFFSSTYVGMYQPISTLSFAIDNAFYGKDAAGFHRTSLLLHLLNILLLYFLLLRLKLKPVQALVPLVFFALHPVQVEPVAWISARSTLLFSQFYIIALIFYARFAENRNIKDVFLTYFFFLLALLSKPSAASFFLLIPVIEYYFYPKLTIRTALRSLLFALPGIVLFIVTYFSRADAGHLHTAGTENFSLVHNIGYSLWSVVLYVIKILVPLHQNPYQTYPEFSLLFYIIPVFFAAGLVFLWFRMKKHRQSLLLCFGLFFVPLSVHLKLIPFGDQMMADRYVYLSVIGVFLLPAIFIVPLVQKMQSLLVKVLISVVSFLLLSLFILQTVLFSETWQNSNTFWTKVIECNPEHPVGYYNRGIDLRDKGRFSEALMDFTRVVELQPSNPDAWMARGTVLNKISDFRKAAEDFTEVIRLSPERFEAYFNRGNAYFNMGNYTDAIRDYATVVQLNPDHLDASFSVILCMIALNYDTEEIFTALNNFISRFPDFADAYYFRGIILADADRDAACSDFQKAADLGHEESKTIVIRGCL